MSFIRIKGLAESCGKCRLFAVSVKVGDITKALATEGCDALFTFFGIYSGDGGWCSAEILRHNNRGNAQKVTEYLAFQSEMAEKNYSVSVRFYNIIVALGISLVAVFFKKCVKAVGDCLEKLRIIALSHKADILEFILVVKVRN